MFKKYLIVWTQGAWDHLSHSFSAHTNKHPRKKQRPTSTPGRSRGRHGKPAVETELFFLSKSWEFIWQADEVFRFVHVYIHCTWYCVTQGYFHTHVYCMSSIVCPLPAFSPLPSPDSLLCPLDSLASTFMSYTPALFMCLYKNLRTTYREIIWYLPSYNWPNLFNMIISRSIYFPTQFCSLLQLKKLHCVWIPHLLYAFLCWWTSGLFPQLSYDE